MYNAVAIIEIKSIAHGLKITDDVLKASNIKLISAKPVCPGKFELMITGDLSSVNVSVEKITKNYKSQVIDTAFMGKIDSRVINGLLGIVDVQDEGNAIGTVETFSAASAIKAADIAVKSSNVDIVEIRTTRGMGGKAYFIVCGDISDVSFAVDTGSNYAKEQGLLLAKSVIGTPHEELLKYL